MKVKPDELEAAVWRAAQAAGVKPELVVAWVVDAELPADASPSVYLNPADYVTEETAAVFRAVGSARAHDYHLRAHRIGLWRQYPGIPDSALTPMIRHELEHAARWERSGTAFAEADGELRALIRGDHAAYANLPTEREANAASSSYASDTLSSANIKEINSFEDFADLVGGAAAPLDVVAETLAELRDHPDWRPDWSPEQKEEYVERARESAVGWAASGAGALERERERPLIQLVRSVQDVHAEPE